MIEIGIHPATLPVARDSRVTVAIRNHGDHRCRRIYVRLDLPPGFILTSGRKYIEVPELGAGETYSHLIQIRPNQSGSYHVRAKNASYRDALDVRHELKLEQLITVEPTAVPLAPSDPGSSTESRLVRQPADDPAVKVPGSGGGLAFLCHSSGDKQQVRDLHRRLKQASIDCWLDEEDLLPGQDWDREIRKAIKRARFVLACFSESSINKAGYVQKELKFALDRADEQPEDTIFLIPVRLAQCEIPRRLSHLHYVDLYQPQGFDKLLKVLQDDNSQRRARR